MNHIYRVVFNAQLGLWQAVCECARAAGKRSGRSGSKSRSASHVQSTHAAADIASPHRLQALSSPWVLSLALGLLAVSPVWADGGMGSAGDSRYGGAGGKDQASGAGGNGGSGLAVEGSGGGGGGGGGGGAGTTGGSGGRGDGTAAGQGGAGGSTAGAAGATGATGGSSSGAGGGGGGAHGFVGTGLTAPSIGGAGGAGGAAIATGFDGGGGGAGGYGAVLQLGSAPFNIGFSVQGGQGGSGGNGPLYGGNGGSGGMGLHVTGTTDAKILIQGGITVNGGGGGGGGGGRATGAGVDAGAGAGGAGGAGIHASQTTIELAVGSQIQGGAGGARGTGVGGLSGAVPGAGGVGISGSDLSVITAGAIAGGLAGDGVSRAPAIEFTGGVNTLELRNGYSFTGLVKAFTTGGAGQDTLALGGADNASFDVGQLGAAGSGTVYQGFAQYAKTGNSTWTLTGTQTVAGDWNINAGTLAVTNNAALGSGTLTLNGGSVASNGSTLANDVVANNDFNISGRLTLTGNVQLNNTVHATAAAGAGHNFGDLTLGGTMSGTGGMTYDSTSPMFDLLSDGPGTFTLAGAHSNSYTGPTVAQGNVWLRLQRDANAVAVPTDLTVSDNAVVTVNSSEQIADNARVTVNSRGQSLESMTPLPTMADGFNLGLFGPAGPIVETIGSLYGNGTVGLGSGTLRVGAGDFRGVISDGSAATAMAGNGGAPLNGKLEKIGPGTLLLSGENSYTGGTTIKEGTLAVGHNRALSTGALNMDDNTTLAFAANGLTLANAIVFTGTNDPTFDTGGNTATLTGGITGAADMTKQGTGTLILGAANNSYSGSTTVAQGTLRAGAVNAFSTASPTTIASGATLDLAGFNQTLGTVNNSGTVSLANHVSNTPGTTLTVTNAWVGNGGTLALSAVLNADGSASDRLLLSGSSAVASGSTAVQITNVGGLGAQTTGAGIEVIGTESGARLEPGSFTLAGQHVDAGAYEYRLTQTAQGAVLQSSLPGPAPSPSPTPVPTPDSAPAYRAEVPLLSAMPAQLRQADMAMVGDLRKRMGDEGTQTMVSTDQGASRRVWGRVLRTDPTIRQQGTVSPESSGHMTGFQAGLDLYADQNLKAGLYVGQLEGDMSVNGFASGVERKNVGFNNLRSRYLGLYGTWQATSGLYADAVLQGADYRSVLHTAGGTTNSATTKGSGWLASLEMGQPFAINSNWQIEPQAQIIYRKLSMDDTALNMTTVQNKADSDWTLRLGARIKGSFTTGAGLLQPYGRINIYKASSTTDVARFVTAAATTDIQAKGGYTATEMAAGASLQLSPTTQLYGELGKLWANGGDSRVKSGVQASVGVKVLW